MTEAVFLDTNILVADACESAPFHDECTALLNRLHSSRAPLFISRQVLREIAATLTRPQPWGPALPPEMLASDLNRYLKLYRMAEETAKSTEQLLAFVRDGRAQGRQVHDANIVAVMLANRVGCLATLNGKDFVRYGKEIQVIGP